MNGRRFVWYVCEDEDSPDLVLRVCSDDKRVLVQYPLDRPEPRRWVTVIGPEFSGIPDAGHCHKFVLCPQWEIGGTITPKSVRELILWCLSDKESRVVVDWLGKPVTPGAAH